MEKHYDPVLESLMLEYTNSFERSNKIDNKVYITITFCGFLFVFITGLFSGISGLAMFQGGSASVPAVIYILLCVGVVISYLYLLIYFLRLLQPEHLTRMDPERLDGAHLQGLDDAAASKILIGLYREVINDNLVRLKNRCDEFTRGLRYVIINVILAFLAYMLQIFIR